MSQLAKEINNEINELNEINENNELNRINEYGRDAGVVERGRLESVYPETSGSQVRILLSP